jgi:hypothetical protein
MTQNSRLVNINGVCSGNRIKLKYYANKIRTFVAKPGVTHVYSNLNKSTLNGQTPAKAQSASKQLQLFVRILKES